MKIIKFDISFYLILILSFLCGNFKDILLLYFIIIFHEVGHVIFIKLFKKELISIKFYAFGGISKYISLVNHNIIEELLIAVGGILIQLFLFILFYYLFKYNFVNFFTCKLFVKNNISLLMFNIIPMVGLDGEKIIHLLFEFIMPYKLVNKIMIIVSFISIVLFVICSVSFKINIIYVCFFLIYKLFIYIKNIKYIENKFYLERYLYDIPYKSIVYFNSNDISSMYQEKYHFFNNIKEYVLLKNKYK